MGFSGWVVRRVRFIYCKDNSQHGAACLCNLHDYILKLNLEFVCEDWCSLGSLWNCEFWNLEKSICIKP